MSNKSIENFFTKTKDSDELEIPLTKELEIPLTKELEIPFHFFTIRKTIENAKISGRKVKILCRNSYWRKVVHKTAQELGVPSRSIIKYKNPHINAEIGRYRNSGCCYDCDGIAVKFTLTPESYVELNNGYQKEVIGNSIIFNQFNQGSCKERCYLSNWGWSPFNFKYKKDELIQKYKNNFIEKEKKIQIEKDLNNLYLIRKRYNLLPYSHRKIMEILLLKPIKND